MSSIGPVRVSNGEAAAGTRLRRRAPARASPSSAGDPRPPPAPLGPGVARPARPPGAALAPLDGPGAPPRQPRHEQLVGVAADLGAEAATDVGGDHPDLRLVEPQPLGERLLGAVGVLGAR